MPAVSKISGLALLLLGVASAMPVENLEQHCSRAPAKDKSVVRTIQDFARPPVLTVTIPLENASSSKQCAVTRRSVRYRLTVFQMQYAAFETCFPQATKNADVRTMLTLLHSQGRMPLSLVAVLASHAWDEFKDKFGFGNLEPREPTSTPIATGGRMLSLVQHNTGAYGERHRVGPNYNTPSDHNLVSFTK